MLIKEFYFCPLFHPATSNFFIISYIYLILFINVEVRHVRSFFWITLQSIPCIKCCFLKYARFLFLHVDVFCKDTGNYMRKECKPLPCGERNQKQSYDTNSFNLSLLKWQKSLPFYSLTKWHLVGILQEGEASGCNYI